MDEDLNMNFKRSVAVNANYYKADEWQYERKINGR